MFCSVRDLCEELGVIDAQSSKLVRFEDGHVDALFLEGVVKSCTFTRLISDIGSHIRHFVAPAEAPEEQATTFIQII